MKTKRKDFTFCRADIYEENDDFLVNVKIWEHDTEENFIEVQPMEELVVGKWCVIVVRTEPKPYKYKGLIKEFRGRTIITLLNESKIDYRQDHRYKVNVSASVESLVYDEKVYPLHKDIEVKVEDISRSGMRLCASKDTFRVGDKLLVRVQSDESTVSKLLLAEVVKPVEVVNKRDDIEEYAAYGCRFIAGDGIDLRPVSKHTSWIAKPQPSAETSASAKNTNENMYELSMRDIPLNSAQNVVAVLFRVIILILCQLRSIRARYLNYPL